MSLPLNTVTVSILEKEYLVTCPPEAKDKLLQAARHLDEKMREIRASGKVYGTERIAVMAALNLTHDLQEEVQHTQSTSETLSDMHSKIDEALGSF